MAREVELDDVFAMLDHCLPGYTRRLADHYWRVTAPSGKVFPKLPKGEHGARRPRAGVQYVRRMVKMFDIGPCAEDRLPMAF